MSKITFEDTTIQVVPNITFEIISTGAMFVALNGVAVIYDSSRWVMIAVHKDRLFTREFTGPIAKNWVSRRVNEFAETVAKPLRAGRKKSRKKVE